MRINGRQLKPKRLPRVKVRSNCGAAANHNRVIVLPGMVLQNPLNSGTGNSRTAGIIASKKRAAEREAVANVLALGHVPAAPADAKVFVRITRQFAGRKRRMDFGGLVASMKSVEDALAEWLGVDDGSDRWICEYTQERAEVDAVRLWFSWGDKP